MLKGEDLHKVYTEGQKEIYAVRGVGLKVDKGEILAIVGPSGAGKSTLLHLLGGLDKPSAGSVYIDGIDIYKISDSKRSRIRNRRIGFVFQFYHLLPGFTAIENVMLPAIINSGRGPARRRIENARMLLEAVGLKERLNHKPSQLSGGEAQRVAIARSLINNPDIVFCDEPTGNLDSKMSEAIWDLISRLSRERRQAFVIATHQSELAKRADRILHIKDGMHEEVYEGIS